MIVRKLKVTVLTLFITFSTLAQEAAYYKVFGKQDGLQIGYIRSMAFDQDQFLWLAGGVNESRSILLNQENTVCLQRFDGVNFHAISLPKEINSVNAIYKRADGKFYLVSNKNLYLFDPMSTQLTLINLKLAAGQGFSKIMEYGNKNFVLTSEGLDVIVYQIHSNLAVQEVFRFTADQANLIKVDYKTVFIPFENFVVVSDDNFPITFVSWKGKTLKPLILRTLSINEKMHFEKNGLKIILQTTTKTMSF